MERDDRRVMLPDPMDEVKLMDITQERANRAVKELLPCDPCIEGEAIDEPMDVEPDDIGVGVEGDLYDL